MWLCSYISPFYLSKIDIDYYYKELTFFEFISKLLNVFQILDTLTQI